MNSKLYKELKELQQEIAEYAKYLETQTYFPYEKIEKFAHELNKIIHKYDE